MLKARHGQRHFNKGYFLVEVCAIVAIAGVLLSVVLLNYRTRVNKARLEESINEMMSIAQASRDFYCAKGYWPVSPQDLAGVFMYSSVMSSPLGGNYQISGLNNMITVSTTVPSGLAQHYYQGTLLQIFPGTTVDIISITQGLPNVLTGRLAYDKKYVYKQ